MRVLEQQAGTFLDRAWSARAKPNDATPHVAQARERLAELDALGTAQKDVKVGGPWVECLRGFAQVVGGEANADAEKRIADGQRALAALAKPSAEDKKRVETAAEFLARAREARKSEGAAPAAP